MHKEIFMRPANIFVFAFLFLPSFVMADALGDVENYLKRLKTSEARFVQIDPLGRVSNGIMIIKRPGKILFEFADPSPLKIAADGAFIVVQDKVNKKLQRVPLSATPLNLLLDDSIDLAGSGAVEKVEENPDFIRVHLRDPDGRVPGKLILIFARNPAELVRWITVDAKDQRTTVVLEGMEQGGDYPQRLFVITDQ